MPRSVVMRVVVVPIEDTAVAYISVREHGECGIRIGQKAHYVLPVPPDDQLTQDIDTLTRYVNQRVRVLVRPDGLMGTEPVEPIPFGYEASEAVGRLRAAFHLDQEDEKP